VNLDEVKANLALEMVNVTKAFTGTVAVKGVHFDARFGEVHALVGENGAGKSTLMKILAGFFKDYTGEIFLDSRKVELHSSAISLKHGIGMIYQELSLARPISIAENVLVGQLPIRFGFWIQKKSMEKETRRRLSKVGLDLDPFLTIGEISQHEAQLVEIAKVLGSDPKIIVMDEPTSSLSQEEVQRLFEIIRNLKKQNMAIIYISHHLPEIFAIADRVTVLRDGERIATKDISQVTPEELVQLMVGKSVEEFYIKRSSTIGERILEVDKISRYGFFHDVSFSLRKGEILGIMGLAGSGRTELARSLCGIDPIDKGSIYLHGKIIIPKSFTTSIKNGIVYLTEDRKSQGIFKHLQVGENIVSVVLPRLGRMGIYNQKSGKGIVRKIFDQLHIVPDNPQISINNLSGGNQQKALLGKWLATESCVYILDEPTRGVDVGAKSVIHSAISELAQNGASVIVISSDLPELVTLSDRVVVLREGKIAGEILREKISQESLLLAASGEVGTRTANNGTGE
jgi:ribose transport system ATP-binding protein